MNRRTFVKAAAGVPLIASTSLIQASTEPIKSKAWPETVCLESPLGHPFPVNFTAELPIVFRACGYTSRFYKELELFRYIAHEWVQDVVLFSGLEIKPRKCDPYQDTRNLLGGKLSIYIDDDKLLDRWDPSAFMREGGLPLPVNGRAPSKYQCDALMGWVDKDGFPVRDKFLGYFLPNKACVVAKIEGGECNVAVEIICHMARYGIKK